MSASDIAFATRLGAATRSRDNWAQLAKFALIGGSGYLVNLVVFTLFVGRVGVPDQLAAIAVAVATPFNFLGNKLWTFA